MAELVALDLPAGPGFVDALRAVVGRRRRRAPPRSPPARPGRRPPARRPATLPRRRRRTATPRPTGGMPIEPGDALVVRHQRHNRCSPRAWSTPTPRWPPRPWPPPPRSASIPTVTAGWPACRSPTSAGSRSSPGRCVTGTPCTVLERFDAAAVEDEARTGRHPRLAGGHRPRPLRRLGLPGGAAGRERAPGVAARQRRHDLRHDRDGLRLRLRRPAPRRGRAARSATARWARRARSWCGARCCCGPTGTAPIPDCPGGWLPTGDGGRLGDDGTLTVFGRMAEVIVTGAEKVWPAAGRGRPRRRSRRGRGGGVEAARPRVG